MNYFFALKLFILFFFFSCGEKFKITTKKITLAKRENLAEDTVIKDNTNSIYFSRVSTPKKYGLRSEYILPPDAKNRDLWIIISGRCRTDNIYSNSSIIAHTVSEDGQILFWGNIPLRCFYADINKWSTFKDSVIAKRSYYNKYHFKVICQAFLNDTIKEKFDIDSLIIEIKQRI